MRQRLLGLASKAKLDKTSSRSVRRLVSDYDGKAGLLSKLKTLAQSRFNDKEDMDTEDRGRCSLMELSNGPPIQDSNKLPKAPKRLAKMLQNASEKSKWPPECSKRPSSVLLQLRVNIRHMAILGYP